MIYIRNIKARTAELADYLGNAVLTSAVASGSGAFQRCAERLAPGTRDGPLEPLQSRPHGPDKAPTNPLQAKRTISLRDDPRLFRKKCKVAYPTFFWGAIHACPVYTFYTLYKAA